MLMLKCELAFVSEKWLTVTRRRMSLVRWSLKKVCQTSVPRIRGRGKGGRLLEMMMIRGDCSFKNSTDVGERHL